MHKLITATALITATITSATTAQTTAAFHGFGYGCEGCVNNNTDAQTDPSKTLRVQTLPNEYSYGFTAATALKIHGFAMFTKTSPVATAVPFTMGTALYEADTAIPTQPSATAVTTGSMTVDATEGWYVTEFATPTTIPAGQNFWVSGLDSNNVFASSILGGTASPLTIYWRRTGTAWSPTGIVSNPGIVIFCEGSAILSATNTPKIPSTDFSIDLNNAPGISPCTLILGISNTKGPLGALPSDLGLIGFTGCSLWVSNEFYVPGFVGTGGTYSWKIPIPNDPTLDGFNFFVQSYVINSLTGKLSFSNAGSALAGTL